MESEKKYIVENAYKGYGNFSRSFNTLSAMNDYLNDKIRNGAVLTVRLNPKFKDDAK